MTLRKERDGAGLSRVVQHPLRPIATRANDRPRGDVRENFVVVAGNSRPCSSTRWAMSVVPPATRCAAMLTYNLVGLGHGKGLFGSCGIVPTSRDEKRGLKRTNRGRMLCCNAVTWENPHETCCHLCAARHRVGGAFRL